MITITSGATTITVDFGAYYPHPIQFSKGYWRKDAVYMVLLNNSHIEVDVYGGHSWLLNFDGSGLGYHVAAVDGVAPTSNADLYDKILAIL